MPKQLVFHNTPALSETNWSQLRFLLVEDNEDHQWLMSAVLKDTGVEVTVVERGEDALELVAASLDTDHPFDLILMDIRLPTIDGHEATRRVRLAGYKGPIVAITAGAMEGEVEACFESGCNVCVSKPFDRAGLRDALAGVLPRTVTEK